MSAHAPRIHEVGDLGPVAARARGEHDGVRESDSGEIGGEHEQIEGGPRHDLHLLGGLAFLVITFYLWRRGKAIWFVALPLLFMLVMPAWAMTLQLQDWFAAEAKNWPLIFIALATIVQGPVKLAPSQTCHAPAPETVMLPVRPPTLTT